MVVQWLFNGCSMACKRLSPCVVVVGVRGEHECGCGSGFCFVSHEFCFLRVEIRVYWGRCFSWKAWQKNPDALCGGASGKVFGCLQRRFFFHLCDYYIGDCGARWQAMRRANEERELRQPRKARFDLPTFPSFMQIFERKESLFIFFWNFV